MTGMIFRDSKCYYIETEQRDCYNFLLRLYEYKDGSYYFIGKRITNDINIALNDMIGVIDNE